MAEAKEAGAASAGETKPPEQIEDEIEGAREELADTVEAVAEKADVKTQAKRKVEEAKEKATEKVSAAPESVREHPVPTAIAGAFAAGFMLAWILRR